MRQVKILSGVSGSGKSRYSGQLLIEKGVPAAYCNADGFFMSDGQYHFDHTKLSLAHGKCFRDFITAVTHDVPLVVVDNTNTTVQEISPYVLGGEAYGYDVEIITLDISHSLKGLEVCAKRNAHGVPKEGILAQAARIASRKLPPWWNSTTIKVDL